MMKYIFAFAALLLALILHIINRRSLEKNKVVQELPGEKPIKPKSKPIDTNIIVENILIPDVVEQAQREIETQITITNNGQEPVQVQSLSLVFQSEKEDVTHEYIVLADNENEDTIPGNGSINVKMTIDVGYKAPFGQTDVTPEVLVEKMEKIFDIGNKNKKTWTVEPRGRVLGITSENDNDEVAGEAFCLVLQSFINNETDTTYQGIHRIYFTTSQGSSDVYTAEIPAYLDVNFINGCARTEKCFRFYNTSEQPTINACDKKPGGGNGHTSSILIRPAELGSFQLVLNSPQTTGVPLQGENSLLALDIYNNLKIDYAGDTTIFSNSENCCVRGLSSQNENVVKGSDFQEGKADLSKLGVMFDVEDMNEPKLVKFVVAAEEKSGESNEILLLPSSPAQASAEEQRKTRTILKNMLNLRKKKIFIANCEDNVFNMLRESFASLYDLTQITLRQENIQVLVDKKPNLLFLDAGNPELNGYEILKKIRARNEIESMPILFLGSPYESEDKILSVLKSGCGYVTKPLTIPDLKARAVELLEQSAMSQGKLPVRGARLQGSDRLDYQIVGKIGEGGMGHIYKAIRLRDNKKVIVKFLPPSEYKNMKAVIRFIQEALTVINFDHENLIQGYDLLMDRSRCFYVMEYIDGESLEETIRREGKLSPIKSLEITIQVAKALEVLNQEHHLVHRDIKPANILLTKEGVVKLVDFGIAKVTDRHCSMTTRGIILGTPYYLSPEQILGKDVTIQSDIYSLGATFYHMLTGEVPFEGNDVLDIIHQRLSKDPRDPRELNSEIPLAISRIVLKMMQKRSSKRYEDAEELTDELKKVYECIKTNRLDILEKEFQEKEDNE